MARAVPALPLVIDPTRARGAAAGLATPWEDSAQTRLHALISNQPVLVQISVAKRLRDSAEQRARDSGDEAVSETHVNTAGLELGLGATA